MLVLTTKTVIIVKGDMHMKANQNIRKMIETRRLKHCEIANKIGVSESTFCRWMRTELPPEKKAKIEKAIQEIAKEVYA